MSDSVAYIFVEDAYDGGVLGVLIGPRGTDMNAARNQWKETTFVHNTYKYRGVVKQSKDKTKRTIHFTDWLVRDKGFIEIDFDEVVLP